MAGQFDRIVQPGESGKIPVKIATNHGSGPVSKSIVVNTNIAGQDAQINLQLKGEIWQAIQATPTSAAFGRITSTEAEKGAERKITIVNNTEEPLKLSEPKSTSPKFKGVVTPLDGKKYELTVTLVPPLVPGNNTANIEIETGVKEMPKLSVPVYAFITASVDVTPTSLNLPPSRTAPLVRQFYVRSNIDKAVKITNLACTNPDIKMDLADVKDAKTFRLSVTIPETYKAPAAGDKITFNTDDASVPLVTIPISETAPVRPMPTSVRPAVNNPNLRLPGVKPAMGQNSVTAKPQGPAPTPAAVKPADEQKKAEEKKAADQAAGVQPKDSKEAPKPAGQ